MNQNTLNLYIIFIIDNNAYKFYYKNYTNNNFS